MSIPIFCRIILGYSVILLLAVIVAAYSIFQLGSLSGTARAALDVDNRMIAYQETLTDAFLSEVRYAGRFLLTRAAANHIEFRQFKEDFKRYMNELTALAPSDEIKARLIRVDELHLRYHELFDQEVVYIKTGQPYAQSRYQQEREKILDAELKDLEALKAALNRNLHDKLQTMEGGARDARVISIASTLILVGLGIGLSLVISKSITKPLEQLTRSVAQDSEPLLDTPSALSRIPEIWQLSDSFLQERRKLREVARSHARFVDSVTEQVATPLRSIKQRVDQLRRDIADTAPHDQKTSVDIIIRETDRLIEHCSRLQQIPTEQPTTNVHAPVAIRNPSSASPPLEDASKPKFQYARLKNSPWNASLGSANGALKSIIQLTRSLLASPWLSVSQAIDTVRGRKVKKQ
jgi:CHASE3 domain sensor protein